MIQVSGAAYSENLQQILVTGKITDRSTGELLVGVKTAKNFAGSLGIERHLPSVAIQLAIIFHGKKMDDVDPEGRSGSQVLLDDVVHLAQFLRRLIILDCHKVELDIDFFMRFFHAPRFTTWCPEPLSVPPVIVAVMSNVFVEVRVNVMTNVYCVRLS
jgi:hypothetical protein